MRNLLPFIIVGLTSGALYGLAALGLVLTFRTSGIFNFAHGGIAAAAAYAFYDLHHELDLPWPVAAFIAVGVLGPILGLAIELLARQLSGARLVVPIVASVGLLLGIQGFLSWKYSPTNLEFPQFLPTSGFELSGVQVQWAQVISVLVGVTSAVGLYVFLRATRLGMAMRGVVDDPALLSLAGVKPARVRAASWMIGSSFAALSGILIAPSLGRDPYLLTLLVVQAFGAAAVGAFRNLPLTFVGGLGVGVAASLTTKYVANVPTLRNLPTAIPFLVLFTVLIVLPKGRLPGPGAGRRELLTKRPPLPTGVRLGVGAAVALFLLAAPEVVGAKLPVFINALIFVFVFISLALLLWTSQQVSLCHAAFVALGASTFSHLTTGADVPWLAALLLAGLATVPLGLIVAVPAIRLSGVYLALATFALALLMERVVYGTGMMFGKFGFRSAPRPDLGFLGGQSDRSFYYLVLVLAVAGCALVVLMIRTRIGRLLRGLGDSPIALVTHGLSVNLTKLMVFSVSAFLAGVAGALFIAETRQVSRDGFGPFQSLLWLAVLVICGRSVIASSLAAAALLVVIPAYAPDSFVNYQTMLFGALAIAATVIQTRPVIAGAPRAAERLRRSPLRARLEERNADADAVALAVGGSA